MEIFSLHNVHCVHQNIHLGTLLSQHSEPNFMSCITKSKSLSTEYDEMLAIHIPQWETVA
jgi:hypothetical protein